jgi:hypothetical protein
MATSLIRRQPALLLLLSLVLALFVGLASPAFQPAASAQDSALVLHDQSVEIDFPQQITFNLNIDSPEPVERIELRYQPEFSEAASAERPDFEQGSTSIDTSYALDLRTRYLPPGINVDYRWIITLENGQTLETEQQRFFFIDNRYDWQVNSEDLVSIYYYDGGSGFGDLAMDVTNRTIERFGSDFDVQIDEPIHIVIYGSVGDFQDALPYNSPEWIGGFADPGQNLIVAGISPGDGAASEMGRMLTHEVIHLLVAQATWNPFNSAPRWLDEGLAINYQEVREERFRRVLDLAVNEGRLIPLPALRSSFPSDPDLAIQSYAQSESVVEFLIEEYGHDAIASILDAYRQGVSHGDAVIEGMGMTLQEIDEEWRDWLDYEGDEQEIAGTGQTTPASPDTLDRVEDALTNLGLMPVLVIGGAIVVVMGLVRMVQAINVRDLDEDVGPDVEYYGQDMFDEEEEIFDGDVLDDEALMADPDDPAGPRQP